MRHIQNLVLIGSSHISPESIKEARRVILEKKPEIVALELDQARFVSLLSQEKKRDYFLLLKELGVKGFLFNLIGAWIEKKLGEVVGVKPGSEMLAAADAAQKNGAQIALIDRDIRITVKRLFQKITWREKLRFLGDLISAPFQRKKRMHFDLQEVPDEKFIKQIIQLVKERYPHVYEVLVAERDRYMAAQLSALMQHYKSIVAVVGAGHVDGIITILQRKHADENRA